MKSAIGAGLVVMLGFVGPQVWAAPIVFGGSDANVTIGSSYPNSDAAAASLSAAILGAGQGVTLINFENQPVGAFSSLNLGNGVTATLAGTLSALGFGISNANPTPNGTFNTTRPDGQKHVFLHSGNGQVTLTFSFATPIDAFGAYITGLDNAGALSLSFNDGAPFTTTVRGPASTLLVTQFLGTTDFGRSFSSVTFTLPTAFYGVGIDDVTFSQAPEPLSTALVGVGLAGLAIGRRKQRVPVSKV